MKLNPALARNFSILLLAFISLSISCNTATKTDSEYTEVLHFQYDNASGDYYEEEDPNANHNEKWLYRELPNDLNPDLASELFHLGYKRSEVRKRDFAQLDAIFVCAPVDNRIVTSCIPIYRDILIFRKRKEVIKIVQLCFECQQSHFIGPWKDISSFGQRGEFKKLKALLD